MRHAILAALLLGGCGSPQPAPPADSNAAGADASVSSAWSLQSSDEGAALVISDAAGEDALRLFCPSGDGRLLVNVPGFEPIGSEERLSFGSGGNVVALVADTRGDSRRGGVSGTGAVPEELPALLSGSVSAAYGAQTSGPHPAPPARLASAFVAACKGDPAAPSTEPQGSQPVSACRVQDGRPVPANAIRAIGTEPFWGARVEGRCVTYSHPDDQDGTRVWTKFSGTAENGTWSGALSGQPFVMKTRPQPGCSDGMSDNRYPIAVTLTVGGEERRGCAEPL